MFDWVSRARCFSVPRQKLLRVKTWSGSTTPVSFMSLSDLLSWGRTTKNHKKKPYARYDSCASSGHNNILTVLQYKWVTDKVACATVPIEENYSAKYITFYTHIIWCYRCREVWIVCRVFMWIMHVYLLIRAAVCVECKSVKGVWCLYSRLSIREMNDDGQGGAGNCIPLLCCLTSPGQESQLTSMKVSLIPLVNTKHTNLGVFSSSSGMYT